MVHVPNERLEANAQYRASLGYSLGIEGDESQIAQWRAVFSNAAVAGAARLESWLPICTMRK